MLNYCITGTISKANQPATGIFPVAGKGGRPFRARVKQWALLGEVETSLADNTFPSPSINRTLNDGNSQPPASDPVHHQSCNSTCVETNKVIIQRRLFKIQLNQSTILSVVSETKTAVQISCVRKQNSRSNKTHQCSRLPCV